jgi:hypothetical protein
MRKNGLVATYQTLDTLREAELEAQTIAECMQVKVKALHVFIVLEDTMQIRLQS